MKMKASNGSGHKRPFSPGDSPRHKFQAMGQLKGGQAGQGERGDQVGKRVGALVITLDSRVWNSH
jgi:hypothetical protein